VVLGGRSFRCRVSKSKSKPWSPRSRFGFFWSLGARESPTVTPSWPSCSDGLVRNWSFAKENPRITPVRS